MLVLLFHLNWSLVWTRLMKESSTTSRSKSLRGVMMFNWQQDELKPVHKDVSMND